MYRPRGGSGGGVGALRGAMDMGMVSVTDEKFCDNLGRCDRTDRVDDLLRNGECHS